MIRVSGRNIVCVLAATASVLTTGDRPAEAWELKSEVAKLDDQRYIRFTIPQGTQELMIR